MPVVNRNPNRNPLRPTFPNHPANQLNTPKPNHTNDIRKAMGIISKNFRDAEAKSKHLSASKLSPTEVDQFTRDIDDHIRVIQSQLQIIKGHAHLI